MPIKSKQLDTSGIVERDAAPTLSANLDVGSASIVSSSNSDIAITPDGTGKVLLDSKVSIESGEVDIQNDGTESQVKLYCESGNSHNVAIKSPPHASYTGGSWALTLPGTKGTANQVLKTDGSGNTSWVNQSSGLQFDNVASSSGTFSQTMVPNRIYSLYGSSGSSTFTTPLLTSLSDGDIVVINTSVPAHTVTITVPTGGTNAGYYKAGHNPKNINNVGGGSVSYNLNGQSIVLYYDSINKYFYASIQTDALTSLIDVSPSTPSNGNILSYNSTNAQWEPTAPSATPTSATTTTEGLVELATNAEATAASDATKALTPSNIGSISTASLDNTTAGFISDITSENLSDLSDVNATSPSNGQVLTWDNTEWIAQDASSSAAYASAFTLISSNTTLVTNTRYIVQATTSSVTLTVPDTTSMAYGDSIWIYVNNTSSSANNTTTLTFNSTGSGKPKIQALSSSSGVTAAVNQNTAGTISIPVKTGPVELTFHTLSNIPTLLISYSPRSLQSLTDIKTETGTVNPNTTLIWDSVNEYYEKSTHAPLAKYSTQFVNSSSNNTLTLSSLHNGGYYLLQVTTNDDVIVKLPSTTIDSFTCEIDIVDYSAVNGSLQILNSHTSTATLYSDRYDYNGSRYENLNSGATHNTDRSVKCKLRIFYTGGKYYVIKQDVSQAPLFGQEVGTTTTLSRGSQLHHNGDSTTTTYELVLPLSSNLQEGDTFSYSFAKTTGNYTLSFDGSESGTTKVYYNGTVTTASNGAITLPHSAGKQELYYRIDNTSTPAFTFITNPDPASSGAALPDFDLTLNTSVTLTAPSSGTLEEIKLVDSTNAITLTLSDASTYEKGFKYNIKRNGANNVTINAASGQTIDGASGQTLTNNYASITIVCDGSSSWYII